MLSFCNISSSRTSHEKWSTQEKEPTKHKTNKALWKKILVEVYRSLVCNTHIPVSRSNIPCYNCLLCGVRGDPERERLASKDCKCLVWCPPVVGHAYPFGFASLNPNGPYVSSSSHVHQVYQQPIPISLERELQSTLFDARDSGKTNSHTN